MTIQEFRNYMASGKPIEGGSDVHMMFHRLSQEALKITAEINQWEISYARRTTQAFGATMGA